MNSKAVKYKTVKAGGLNVFYREAGPMDGPVVLLLHGYPTSSHMFRNLIPMLSGKYHVIAPDLPGFGFTESPSRKDFNYTFDNLTAVIQGFIDKLGLKRFAMYVFDYGAPVGWRLAVSNPEKITGIISQNGNCYVEGLSDGWNPIKKYWADPSEENRQALRMMIAPETTKWPYTHGVANEELVAPESYTLDQTLLNRPGNVEIQLDLFKDYAKNVDGYPMFQEYFRKIKPALLAVWGDKDPFFLPPGAEAFKRDLPNAIVKFYPTGHFALETHHEEIGNDILEFLKTL